MDNNNKNVEVVKAGKVVKVNVVRIVIKIAIRVVVKRTCKHIFDF